MIETERVRSLGGVIDVAAGFVCWHSDELPAHLPESLPRRLLYTAEKVCAGLGVHPFEQLCWDGDTPFFRLFLVERESPTVASFRIEHTIPFDPQRLFGVVPTQVFKSSDLVYLLSDTEPTLAPGPRVVFVSESFEKMTGFRSEDIVGKTPRILHGSETEPESRTEIRQGLRDWAHVNSRLTNYRKDGTPFRVELDITPVRDEIGWWVYWFSTQRDIPNEERERASRQHRAKLESLGELAAGVAHEINTPMQCIAANLSFLNDCGRFIEELIVSERPGDGAQGDAGERAREPFVDEQKWRSLRQASEAIQDSEVASQRVIDIVRAMKSMAHPSGQRSDQLDLKQVVEQAITVSRNRWKYAAELDFECADDEIRYDAAASEISQIVINLVVNAADAITDDPASGGEMGTITVRLRSEEEGLVLEVEDDGPGIPAAIVDRVFDPLFTTKEVGKGSGQGLAIIHNLVVRQHGGSIELLPAEPRGTIARVTLPLRSVETDNRGADR